MAKLDKEALMKQKFWIGLGAFLLLWAIGFLTLRSVGAGPIEEKKKAYQGAVDGIKGHTTTAKNTATFLPPWKEYRDAYNNHKQTIWSAAWEAQKDLMKWPEASQLGKLWSGAATFADWKKAASDETGGGSTTIMADYREQIEGHYKKQFVLTAAEVAQDKRFSYRLERDLAPVEFKDGRMGFETMMCPSTGTAGGAGPAGPGGPGGRPGGDFGGRPNPGANPGQGGQAGGKTILNVWEKVPTPEEVWLAQEDYSVKYELLQVVRRTVETLGRFECIEPKAAERAAKKSWPLPRKMTFRNSLWEIQLQIDVDGTSKSISKGSTIKNVSKSPMLLSNPNTKGPLVFRLQQGNKTFNLKVSGEPLSAEATQGFGVSTIVEAVDLSGDFNLVQAFDWSVAPIRRIDDIKLGYHSHRTSNVALVAGKHFVPEVDPNAPPAEPVAPPPGETPGVPSGGEGQMGTGPAAPADATEVNGITKNRYMHVTGQARSLPLAMTLVLEQNHLHDLLIQLATSRLRVQITQIHFQHIRDIASQLEVPPVPTTPGTGMGPLTGPGPVRPGPGPGREGPGGSGPGGSGPGNTTGNLPDLNLVQLTIYGIATLYEKSPPPKPAEVKLEPAKQ